MTILGPVGEEGVAVVSDVETPGGKGYTYVLVTTLWCGALLDFEYTMLVGAGGVAVDVVLAYGGPPAEEEPDFVEDDAGVVDAEPPPAGTVVRVPVPIGVATPPVIV